MITELLAGLFFDFSNKFDFSRFSQPEIVIEENLPQMPLPSIFFTPSPSATPTQSPSIAPTPKPSKTPRPSRSPRSTSTPAPTPKSSVKPSLIPKPSATPSATSGLTTQSILNALNSYRSKNGVGNLQIDTKLQEYAQSRADYLKSIGKLDNHAKHKEFMANDGFGKLGFNAIAENQGYNYKGDAKGLIESFYGKSSGHNKNQLNSEYTHVGIGINGPFTDLVFGGRKR